MSQVRFVYNGAGYRALMQSAACGTACQLRAQEIAQTAQSMAKRGTYETVSPTVVGDRQVALVHTGDYEAIIDQNKRGTLGKAL